MSTPKKPIKIRVLVLKEGADLVAQCLEYDIAAQAATLPELKKAFSCTVAANVHLAIARGEKPLADLDPAPSEYWQKWRKSNLKEPVQVKKAAFGKVPVEHRNMIPQSAEFAFAL